MIIPPRLPHILDIANGLIDILHIITAKTADGTSYKYTRRSSLAVVMRLHMGHSFVAPRQRSQHARQHVCQQPVLTVGSVYASRQIRHCVEPADGPWDSCTHRLRQDFVW
jgi:hypothetical protein